MTGVSTKFLPNGENPKRIKYARNKVAVQQRKELVLKYKCAGFTVSEIGHKLSLTPQRIHKILRDIQKDRGEDVDADRNLVQEFDMRFDDIRKDLLKAAGLLELAYPITMNTKGEKNVDPRRISLMVDIDMARAQIERYHYNLYLAIGQIAVQKAAVDEMALANFRKMSDEQLACEQRHITRELVKRAGGTILIGRGNGDGKDGDDTGSGNQGDIVDVESGPGDGDSGT